MNKNILTEFFNGECHNAYEYFGAHPTNDGYVFRVYAPHAKAVKVIGDFNNWDGKDHFMNKIDDRGVYELYTNIKGDYNIYRYEIETWDGRYLKKTDPYGFYGELRPNTASKTYDINAYKFNDSKWMKSRTKCEHAPLNIYEIHLGSFARDNNYYWIPYDSLAPLVVKYAKKHHFTHVELLPIMEHPFDGSWGYQCSNYYAITSRFGNPSQLMYFIDYLHQNGIGVITDFVPVHFVKDEASLGEFDGGHVYESDDVNNRESQWGTYLFDYSKPAVMSFMLSCAAFYLDKYHFDGIRFDAISNMIFKDGNKFNGTQDANLNWLKKTNNMLSSLFPTAMLIAEDSSDFGKVTAPTFEGGLGFDYKWDLGWMNDTLKYLHEDPIYRGYDTNLINFSMYYFYNEKFMLPLSHDEVVHMKGSIINKMFGSYEQKFQQARTLYTYMFTHPGKKLNFMGNELASFDEWGEDKVLPTHILQFPIHDAFNKFFQDISGLYSSYPLLFDDEYNQNNFRWIQCTNNDNVFIYERNLGKRQMIIVLNFSSSHFEHYRFNVSKNDGHFVELLNTDDYKYNGYGFVNNYDMKIENNQIGIRLQSFSAVVLEYVKE